MNRDIFQSSVNTEIFHQTESDIFNIFAQKLDCGYTLEPPIYTIYILIQI